MSVQLFEPPAHLRTLGYVDILSVYPQFLAREFPEDCVEGYPLRYNLKTHKLVPPNASHFARLQQCSAQKKFVVLPVDLFYPGSSDGTHINMLIYNTRSKELERFEPHGAKTFGKELLRKLDKALTEFFEETLKRPVAKFFPPSDFCPKIGFQFKELETEKEYYDVFKQFGECASWSLWYAQQRLLNPTIDRKELLDNLYAQLSTSGVVEFSNYIRRFRAFASSFAENALRKNAFINAYMLGIMYDSGTWPKGSFHHMELELAKKSTAYVHVDGVHVQHLSQKLRVTQIGLIYDEVDFSIKRYVFVVGKFENKSFIGIPQFIYAPRFHAEPFTNDQISFSDFASYFLPVVLKKPLADIDYKLKPGEPLDMNAYYAMGDDAFKYNKQVTSYSEAMHLADIIEGEQQLITNTVKFIPVDSGIQQQLDTWGVSYTTRYLHDEKLEEFVTAEGVRYQWSQPQKALDGSGKAIVVKSIVITASGKLLGGKTPLREITLNAQTHASSDQGWKVGILKALSDSKPSKFVAINGMPQKSPRQKTSMNICRGKMSGSPLHKGYRAESFKLGTRKRGCNTDVLYVATKYGTTQRWMPVKR